MSPPLTPPPPRGHRLETGKFLGIRIARRWTGTVGVAVRGCVGRSATRSKPWTVHFLTNSVKILGRRIRGRVGLGCSEILTPVGSPLLSNGKWRRWIISCLWLLFISVTTGTTEGTGRRSYAGITTEKDVFVLPRSFTEILETCYFDFVVSS